MINWEDLEQMISQGVIDAIPDKDLFENEIKELKVSGFIREQNDKVNLMFQNSLTWEVVYETLLYAERRRLHYLISKHIEKKNVDNLAHVANILLYHYEQSLTYDECVKYGAMAGDKAAAMYANDDAVQFYKRSLSALDNFNKKIKVDRSLLHEKVGDVYSHSGEDKKSELSFMEAIELWKQRSRSEKVKLVPWKIKNSTRLCSLYQKVAVSYERQVNYDASLEWLDRAIEIMPQRPGNVSSKIFASKSVALFRKGNYKEGIEWGKNALRLAKRSGDKSDIGYANNMLANSYIETGDIKKAIIYLKNSIYLYQENNNFPGLSSASSNLGSCYGMTSEMGLAIKYFNIALDIDKKIHNQSSISVDHQNLAMVYLILSRFDEAIEHFLSVLNSQDVCREDIEASVSIGLCQCFIGQGDGKKAESYINRAMSLLKGNVQSGYYTEAELVLTELYLFQNHPDDALVICKNTLNKIHNQNAAYYEVKAERLLGVAQQSLNNIDEAIAHFNTSIKVSREIGMLHDEALSLLMKAELQLIHKLNDKKVSISDIEHANKIFKNMNAESDYGKGCLLINQYK